MPEDRWPYWAAEQAGTNRLPSAASTLLLFAVVTVILLGLLYRPDAAARETTRVQSPACAEQARLERHGVHSGPSYRRAARACASTR